MKLRGYIENLNKIIRENPRASELEVIYSIDSEGNSFHPVYFEPTEGHFEDGEFLSKEQLEDWDRYAETNAICIN